MISMHSLLFLRIFHVASATRRSCAHGLSLIEMLVVIVIIAIMSAVAIPCLMPKRFEVRTAVFNLRSNLMKARTSAVKSNADAKITFDASADSYNGTCDGVTLFQTMLNENVDLMSNGALITFKSLGTASSAKIILASTQGNCTVRVKASGRIFIDGNCPDK